MKARNCHDCGAKEGEVHRFGCDMERCAFCGGQLICCDCAYEKLDIDCSEGTWAYENGLTKEQERKWLQMLEGKGRIPYIFWPWVCARCGKLDPILFIIPQEEWEHYIEKEQRDKILCQKCYDEIKNLIDTQGK